MYKLIVKEFKGGWFWRYYYRKVMLARSNRGYGDSYRAKKAFTNFARNIHSHEVVVERKDGAKPPTHVVAPNEKV